MKLLSNLFLPAAALVVSSSALFAADAIELKQKWIAGKQYFQTTASTQETSMAIGPQKIDQKVATTMEMSIAVRMHEDGKRKRLTVKYERVAMDMEMNGQKMGFDSSKPEQANDPLGFSKSIGATAGKELKVLADANDQISDIENFDEFVKALGSSPTPGFDVGKMFTRDSMAQMMKQGTLQAMPDHPVKPGDSWPFAMEVDLPQMGKVGVKGTYTFQKMSDHGGVACAEISADAAIALDLTAAGRGSSPANAAVAQLGMKVTDGTLKGTIWFDPKLGFTRDAQLVQAMTLTMKNPTDPTATLNIPVKQDISATLTKVIDLK